MRNQKPLLLLLKLTSLPIWFYVTLRSTFAQPADSVIGQYDPPNFVQRLGYGDVGLGKTIGALLNIFYVASILVLMFMLIWAGITWISSHGDKEKISKARGTIINSLIGIMIIALAYFITNMLILPVLGINKLVP